MRKTIGFIILIIIICAAWTAQAADVTVYRYKHGAETRLDKNLILDMTAQSLAFGAADESKSFTIAANGRIRAYTVTMPNFSNAVTGNLSITDAGSREIYNSDGRSEADFAKNGATHVYNLRDIVGLYGTCTVTVTLSGVPGGSGGTVSVHFEIE
jgi:hypothetical protein